MTDPQPGGRVLVVSISSLPASLQYDPSCTLFPGEHPFVTRDSYVAYRFTKFVDAEPLERGVADGIFIAHSVLEDRIIKFVDEGLFDSPHSTPAHKRFLRRALGIDEQA